MLDASHQQPSPAQPSQILGADGPGSRDRVAMMPRFLFAAIAAVLLLASCYCIYQSLPREPRGLETDRPVHDFEHRSQGELLAAVFPVTNRGTEVIRIRTVLKDCGCSEAVVPKGVLSPGETMTVRVAWDTKGRRGKSTTGVQILYRKESDPLDTQELHLTLTAQIEPEYDIHPSVVEFDLGNGGVQTSELKFTSRSKPDVRLTHAFISHPALHAERATNGTIRITFDPSRWRGEDGPLETALIVMTTSPNEAQYSVPIRCVNQTVSPHFEARSANGSLRNQEASR